MRVFFFFFFFFFLLPNKTYYLAANMAQQEALDWIEKGTKLLDTVPEFEVRCYLTTPLKQPKTNQN